MTVIFPRQRLHSILNLGRIWEFASGICTRSWPPPYATGPSVPAHTYASSSFEMIKGPSDPYRMAPRALCASVHCRSGVPVSAWAGPMVIGFSPTGKSLAISCLLWFVFSRTRPVLFSGLSIPFLGTLLHCTSTHFCHLFTSCVRRFAHL